MRRHLDRIRLAVMGSVFLLLVFLPMASLYVNFTGAHAVQHLEGWERVVHAIVNTVAGQFVSDLSAFDAVKGTTWSATIFGHRISDPLAVAAQAAARLDLGGPLLATAAIPVVVGLLLGRVFCGWICPAGFLFELIDRLRRLLVLLGIPVLDVRLDSRLKYGVLLAVLALSAATGGMAASMVYPPAVVGREVAYLVTGGALGAGAGFLAVVAAFDLAVARRGFCRYLCPGGALYALLGRVRLLRVRRKAKDCIDCGACARQCGFGLDPMRDRIGQDCTTCAACIAVCPTKALTMAPRRAGAAAVVALAAAFFAAFGGSASAHHVLGRPSYALSGDASTPSASQMETQIGDYFVTMMAFPAFIDPGQPGRIKFYALHIDSGARLAVPVRFVVTDGGLFGGNEELLGVQSPVDNVYSQDFQFRDAGEYLVSVVFEADGAPYRVDFPVQVGSPFPWTAVSIMAGAVVLTLGAAAVVRRRRGARRT